MAVIGFIALLAGWRMEGSNRLVFAAMGGVMFVGALLAFSVGGEWRLEVDGEAISWRVPPWDRRTGSGRIALSEVERIWIEQGGVFSQMVVKTAHGVVKIPGECLGPEGELREWLKRNCPDLLMEGPYPELSGANEKDE